MLEPYTVLDFTDERGEIGPMLLGDLGADVIRVEPAGGNRARRIEPFVDDANARSRGVASLSFQSFNRNKRSLLLDPASSADRDVLTELIRRADFLFESAPDGPLASYGLDANAVRALNPNLVVVRLSPFGSGGPYENLKGNDLTLAALGGPVALQGAADRAPVRLSVPQVWRHAGVEAAAGALVAHHKRLRDGQGQFVDLSAQSAMTWTMLNAMDAHAIQGFDFQRGIGFNTGTTQFNIVFPTADDGHIVALPMSGVILGCLDWMIEDGVAEERLRDIDWAAYDENIRDPDAKPLNIYQGEALCAEFLRLHTKQELYEFGLANGVTLAPVNTLSELLALEHIHTRAYWQPRNIGEHGEIQTPGLWAKAEPPAMAIRHDVPSLGEHSAEIRNELASPVSKPEYPADAPEALPFDGIKVTDFAWVGVGPISSKYLADHGATVVRVESESRPDVLRGNGPFKDAEPGLDRSQFFGDFNTS